MTPRLGYGLVRERVAPRAAALEPDLDAVAGLGTGDLSTHHAVVVRVSDAVAFAAGPFRRGCALHGTAVYLVLHRDGPEAALREDAYLLWIPVRDRELEIEHRQRAVFWVDICLVKVERLDCHPDRRDRVGRMRRRLGEREVEAEGLNELGLDEGFIVGEDEAATGRALAELRGEGNRAVVLVGVVGRFAIGDVQLVRADARVKAGD